MNFCWFYPFVFPIDKCKTVYQDWSDIIVMLSIFDRYGLECLFRFFSYGLEKHFREEIYSDFQEETLKDSDLGQLYGLEKFWAFLKYYRNSSNLDVQDRLNERLSKYKSIEDFRVEMVSKIMIFLLLIYINSFYK